MRRLGEPETETDGREVVDPPKSSLELLHEELKTEDEDLPQHVIDARAQLSYSFESLNWDSSHQRNESETYCYCGESGDWYKKMLQCKDCLQWFHQECIRSLSYQLLSGDR